jgi:hypothetical protein
MKTKYKKIYVSDDGIDFDSRKSCREWEEYKLYYTPVHLSNDQIITLIKTAFPGPFLQGPKDCRGEISLYVRRDIESGSHFDFYFSIKDGDGKIDTYDGSIYEGTRDIAIGLGYEEEGKYHISEDWAYWNHISMRKVYNYLRSIAYFQKKKEAPDINPIFRKEGWHLIYSKDYSVSYPEVIKDPAESRKHSKKEDKPPVIIHLNSNGNT